MWQRQWHNGIDSAGLSDLGLVRTIELTGVHGLLSITDRLAGEH